jgi:cyanophycinase
MEAVDRYLLAQLKTDPRVVCLPTAAGAEGPARIAYWSDLGVGHFYGLGAQVEALPVIDRSSANNPDFVERIQAANFIYLSGGKPSYLYGVLKDSLAWKAILKVLSQGGVLAGCSAGAMIMGERIPGVPRGQPAFGLLPGTVVLPHFDEIPAGMVKTARFLTSRKMTLVGIEGNTALVGDDGHYQVIGSGGVLVWLRQAKSRYTHGQAVRL